MLSMGILLREIYSWQWLFLNIYLNSNYLSPVCVTGPKGLPIITASQVHGRTVILSISSIEHCYIKATSLLQGRSNSNLGATTLWVAFMYFCMDTTHTLMILVEHSAHSIIVPISMKARFYCIQLTQIWDNVYVIPYCLD